MKLVSANFQLARLMRALMLMPLLLGLLIFSGIQAKEQVLHTDCLFVFFDAGETGALLPVLQARDKEGKDFRVLVMATAETVLKPEMFPGKRLVLNDFGITEKIDKETPRSTLLSKEAMARMKVLNPKVVVTGVVSEIQQQILEQFVDGTTAVYLDSFNYDPAFDSFKTVLKVENVAKEILCPSQNVVELLVKENDRENPLARHVYHVVGKPSLQVWENDVTKVDRVKALQALGLKSDGGKVISFMGGYGAGYDVVNPIFDECAAKLREEGYQVIIQPHPKLAAQKITTVEVLAISDYVVGYNSSVILDAALIGKNALFMVPAKVPFEHFAIKQGLIAKVGDCAELLQYIKADKKPGDVRQAFNLPKNSIQVINDLIDKWISQQNAQPV